MIDEIDECRGAIPRAAYVRLLLERGIKVDTEDEQMMPGGLEHEKTGEEVTPKTFKECNECDCDCCIYKAHASARGYCEAREGFYEAKKRLIE